MGEFQFNDKNDLQQPFVEKRDDFKLVSNDHDSKIIIPKLKEKSFHLFQLFAERLRTKNLTEKNNILLYCTGFISIVFCIFLLIASFSLLLKWNKDYRNNQEIFGRKTEIPLNRSSAFHNLEMNKDENNTENGLNQVKTRFTFGFLRRQNCTNGKVKNSASNNVWYDCKTVCYVDGILHPRYNSRMCCCCCKMGCEKQISMFMGFRKPISTNCTNGKYKHQASNDTWYNCKDVCLNSKHPRHNERTCCCCCNICKTPTSFKCSHWTTSTKYVITTNKITTAIKKSLRLSSTTKLHLITWPSTSSTSISRSSSTFTTSNKRMSTFHGTDRSTSVSQKRPIVTSTFKIIGTEFGDILSTNSDNTLKILLGILLPVVVMLLISFLIWKFRKRLKMRRDRQTQRSLTNASYEIPRCVGCAENKNGRNISISPTLSTFPEVLNTMEPLIDLGNCDQEQVANGSTFSINTQSWYAEFESKATPPDENPANIVKEKLLGEGNFGKVFKGVLYKNGLQCPGMDVAIKTPKENPLWGDEEIYCLNVELKILLYIGDHANVVKLIGSVKTPSNLGLFVLLTEYCEFGDLKHYLSDRLQEQKIKKLKPGTLVDILKNNCLCLSALLMYALQISNGAHFLATQKTLIHRDLALRNILLTKDHIAKISDFGLAAKGTPYKGNHQRQVPYHWLPPESITEHKPTFTVQSDVWSFGVLMWELFTFGGDFGKDVPTGSEDLRKWLMTGKRFRIPSHTPDIIKSLIYRCWDLEPTNRPTFVSCRRLLCTVLNDSSQEVYDYVMNMTKFE